MSCKRYQRYTMYKSYKGIRYINDLKRFRTWRWDEDEAPTLTLPRSSQNPQDWATQVLSLLRTEPGADPVQTEPGPVRTWRSFIIITTVHVPSDILLFQNLSSIRSRLSWSPLDGASVSYPNLDRIYKKTEQKDFEFGPFLGAENMASTNIKILAVFMSHRAERFSEWSSKSGKCGC